MNTENFDNNVEKWRKLKTDDAAILIKNTLDAADIEPMITYGTNPAIYKIFRYNVPKPTMRLRKSLTIYGF